MQKELEIEELEADDSEIIYHEEVVLPNGAVLCGVVTENILKAHSLSAEEIQALKEKYSRKTRLKYLLATRNQRVQALAYLASKADESAHIGEVGGIYSELVSTNAMQTIINRWKDTGNTKLSIKSLNKIKGSAKKALDTVVGEKGRTIKDYLSYTMAEATDDLHLLEAVN